MDARFDAVVIGAGLAGCGVAIGLARRGHSVLLLEAERYPVHKLCGEFLSPEATTSLEALGVDRAVRDAGAVEIRRVAVTSATGAVWREELPGAALGVSRRTLDPILFGAAREAGADAREGARVTEIEGEGEHGFLVRYTSDGHEDEVEARLVVGCYGKRSPLDRRLGRAFLDRRHDFVAFKAHHRGADFGDCIELHGFEGGYCGMSHVEGGAVNVCLIAWTRSLREAGSSFAALRDRALRTNPHLAARLDQLEPVTDDVLAIAQVPFAFKELFARDVMMVGDTAGMIAPLCGDGMAMALRAAELAVPPASEFLAGRVSFAELRARYTRAWRREFAPRMRLGLALQEALFRPRISRIGIATLNRAPWLGRAIVWATRGATRREEL